MPTLVEESSSSIIPTRRPHDVIDVDSLADDHEPTQRPRRRLIQNDPEVPQPSEIIVLDSDDEILAGPSTRPVRRAHAAQMRSPPPPPLNMSVPPVPTRPRSSRHGPSRTAASGLVRPNEVPFAFEAALRRAHQTVAPRPPPNPLTSSAPSHHRPAMGFGGALLSMNRQHAIEQHIEHQRARERYFERLRQGRGITSAQGFLSRTLGRFPTWLFADVSQEEVLDAFAFSDDMEDQQAEERDIFGDFDHFGAHIRRVQQEYKIAYTHPYPPAAGFTHDFAPPPAPSPTNDIIVLDDEPGPSSIPQTATATASSDVTTSLVCASCGDPLLLTGNSYSEEERVSRRLWGLRCGHMLDGKCVAKFMHPPPAPQLQADGVEITVAGGGEGRDQMPPAAPHGSVEDGGVVDSNRKGKGKATESPRAGSPSPATESTPAVEDATMRSRLRPRDSAGHYASRGGTAASTRPTARSSRLPLRNRLQGRRTLLVPETDESAPPTPLPTLHPRSKGKGKQKTIVPRIEEQYEWQCPVPNCKRVHLSVKMVSQGWSMDETRGAIGIFA